MRPLILIFLVALFVVTVNGLCPPGQLSCDDEEECVSSSSWCDQEENCGDGSDEEYCTWKKFWDPDPNDCKSTHFLCKDGRCIPKSAECNGHSDCKDGSDEYYCEKSKEQTEAPKSSSEESKSSSEKTKTSSEEPKTSDKKDEADTLTQDNYDYDNETPNLSATKSTPPETTEIEFFIKEKPMTPVINGYYEKRRNGLTTQTPRTYIPTSRRPQSTSAPSFGNQGHYYPPPPPTYPRSPLNYPSFNPTTQPTPNVYRQPYDSSDRSGIPSYGPGIRRQPTNYNSDPSRQSTNYNSDPRRQSTNYNSDPSRQSTYPNERGQQQPTYHHPTSRHDPYNHFHENVIPPANGLSHRLTPHVPRYTGQRKILPRFNFLRNFSTDRNDESVSRGVDWILRRREPDRGWGADTPRAIVALSLANNSFENDGMKNYLNLQVGLKLLSPQDLRVTELNHLVLALLATCQDPSDFQGWDLGLTLLEKWRTPHPHPFTLLTACLAGQNLTNRGNYYLNALMEDMHATPDTEKRKDRLSLSLSALSCYLRSNPSEVTRLAQTLRDATSKLLQLKLHDGSFGSVYSTAIAAQALMSLNDTLGWNPDSTFSFLRERQDINGSFGDFLATYYVIPALRGRSLLHLRSIRCTPKTEELTPQEILEYPGEKQYLKYSLHFGYPLSNAYSVQMHVPLGINFFDVMRVAEYQNNHFNFQYDKKEEKINVYSISGVPNDFERALAWHLYMKRGDSSYIHITEDVRKLTPRSNEHYVFWYHYVGFRPQLQ